MGGQWCCRPRWRVWRGRALEREGAHFALDGTWVVPRAPWREALSGDVVEQPVTKRGRRLGAARRARRSFLREHEHRGPAPPGRAVPHLTPNHSWARQFGGAEQPEPRRSDRRTGRRRVRAAPHPRHPPHSRGRSRGRPPPAEGRRPRRQPLAPGAPDAARNRLACRPERGTRPRPGPLTPSPAPPPSPAPTRSGTAAGSPGFPPPPARSRSAPSA